jgi:hypothetical protein
MSDLKVDFFLFIFVPSLFDLQLSAHLCSLIILDWLALPHLDFITVTLPRTFGVNSGTDCLFFYNSPMYNRDFNFNHARFSGPC